MAPEHSMRIGRGTPDSFVPCRGRLKNVWKSCRRNPLNQACRSSPSFDHRGFVTLRFGSIDAEQAPVPSAPILDTADSYARDGPHAFGLSVKFRMAQEAAHEFGHLTGAGIQPYQRVIRMEPAELKEILILSK